MKKSFCKIGGFVLSVMVLSACVKQESGMTVTTTVATSESQVSEDTHSDDAGSTQMFTPGSYQATARGHNGPMLVETTVTENQILEVKILEHFESNGVLQVIDVVPAAIVQEQSLAVDTVAGATLCGRAVIAATTDCLTQAGGDIEKLSVKKGREALQSAIYEADVIVIGGGGSGLSAGVSAHQNGANVIIVEKLGIIGGSTIFSGGAMNAADPDRGTGTDK